MNADLTDGQRAVLQAMCDTFVPSIDIPNDPLGFWHRSASDIGVDCVLSRNLVQDVPESLYQGLTGMLDALAAKGFVNASQEQRESILLQISSSSPQVNAGVTFFQKQTVQLTYALPENPTPDKNWLTYGSPRGQNPNWEVLNYPGPVSTPPVDRPKKIKTVTPSGENQTLEADVCIIGSGAGGAVIASKMAKRGLSVVVLEAGGHYSAADFHQLELWGYRHLWYKGGATPTADGNVLLLAGGSLGGGTEVNWMNCVRTPQLIREDWASQFGLVGVDTQEFEQYLDEVEQRIQANQQTAIWNAQNARMSEGCQKLGYLSRRTFVNWDPKLFQPLMAGYTGFGDQTGGKQTARRTFLLDAFQNGAQIMVHCRANRIFVEQGRAAGVEATYADPQGRTTKLRVRARLVVVACGSLESPALLLRSGIGGPAVGKYLHLQPGGAVYGVYKEKQKGWWGSPMTTNCEQFTNTGDGFGFYMEIPAFGPGFVASVIPWVNGRQHKEMMTKVPYISTFIWFLRDKGYGQVTIDKSGNSVPTYQLSDNTDQKNFRHAAASAIRIHEAAGAQEILVSLAREQIIWKRGQNLESYIEKVSKQALVDGAQPMISAHQLSSCRMGKDPATSVANSDGELHDIKGVWIGDGSACPTALGANPMVTIMALASRTADKMVAQMPATHRQNVGGAVRNAPRRESVAQTNAFVHILELTCLPGQASKVIEIIGNQAIPRIIPAEGFIADIVLQSLTVPNHVTAISFWKNEVASNYFDEYGFDQVNALLKEVLSAQPVRRRFRVGASTNPRIQGFTDMKHESSANRAIASNSSQNLNAIPGMAVNMVREMVGMMTNPVNMVREMAGIITNPLRMRSLGERMLLGPAQQAGGISVVRRATSISTVSSNNEFVDILELTCRQGQARKVIEIIGGQAIPKIIQPAEGSIDEIVLQSLSDPNHVTAMSFWKNEVASDCGFDQVTALLKDVLAAQPVRRPFHVGASTNPRIVGFERSDLRRLVESRDA